MICGTIDISSISTGKRNKYYDPELHSTFLNQYMSICPLWCGIDSTENDTERISNACIESHFGYLKAVAEVKNWKPSRFLRLICEIMDARSKEYAIMNNAIPKKLPQEEWDKRKKSKFTYFKKNRLMALESKQKMTLYDNGLVQNILYYLKLGKFYKQKNYPIIFNEKLLKTTLGLGDIYRLSYDKKMFYKDKWLNENVMDMSLSFFCQNDEKAVTVYSAVATEIFHYKFELTTLENVAKLDQVQIIMFAVNIGYHWCLLVADIPNKQILWLDPNKSMTANQKKAATLLPEFLKLVRLHNDKNTSSLISDEDWSSSTLDVPTQKDDYNCGVFCIYYAECILNSREILKSFNADNYRKYLLSLLLKNSSDVSLVCVYCAEESLEVTSLMIGCDCCNRWFHIGCISTASNTNFETPDDDYICEFCMKFKSG